MPILEKITEGLLYPLPWVSYVILLFFLVTCCIISTWIATILLKKPLRKNVIAFLLSLFAALAIIEGFMVATGFMATYLEERGLGRPLDPGYCSDRPRIRLPNSAVNFNTRAFSYSRTTNNHGFSDKNWEEKNKSIRVLALGDSFTEGDGTSVDSTWVSLAESRFLADGLDVEILNAGICGSDPFEELKKYRVELYKLNPDIIVIPVSTSDFVYDCYVRGGLDRYDTPGLKLSFAEMVYAFSRIGRLVYSNFGYNDLLMQTKDTAWIKKESMRHIADAVEAYALIDSIPVHIVLFPWDEEVISESYVYSLNISLANACEKYPSVYYHDLRECYSSTLKKEGLVSKNLWWTPIDGHHKPLGYVMMGDCIYENIKSDVLEEIAKHEFKTHDFTH